ncbi:Uncharacterised protein [Mycobacteroides abscessus subsp. abscessus]|nr:Uncharacterised protein [Mycobacteroides abscessus subsp. abscessus]
MPYEPMVRRTGLPFSPRTSALKASVYLRPSWKTCPISMPRADTSGPAPSGEGSPSRTSAASMVPSATKSRPATIPTMCLLGASAPVIHDEPSTIRGSTRNRIPLSSKAFGPTYPFTRNGLAAKSASSSSAYSAGSSAAPRRFSSISRSPGTPIPSSSHSPPGWRTFSSTFFNVSAAVISRPRSTVLAQSTSVAMVGASGVS